MNIKIIKRPIPVEICEDGGASVIIVGKDTVDLETSIDEAKDVLIVVGDKLLVKGMFVGLFKSMVNGIGRDGNARQLGDFITLYPVPTGEFDLDKGWQPGVNGVRIRARLMNELELDISNWEFEDVTPGRQAFTLASVECGYRQLGVVDFVHPVWINGKPLPGTDEIRIDWAVEGTDRHGTIAAAKVTSTASRATVAADALAELASPAYDGKTIVFTVRGNFASAKIAATLKYAEPPDDHAALTDLRTSGEDEPDELSISDGVTLVFDKADPESRVGHLVVDGVVQAPPVTVENTMATVMWTFGREELIGHEVTFKFRYEDGTEVGEIKKTVRAERE